MRGRSCFLSSLRKYILCWAFFRIELVLTSHFMSWETVIPRNLKVWTVDTGQLDSVRASCGEGCFLKCTIISTTDRLKKQDKRFRGRTSLFKENIGKGNASLLLKDVVVGDEGRYMCLTKPARCGRSTATTSSPASEPATNSTSLSIGGRT
uniref:Immunoglobulin V-set domain-containing protein n=1 Tax=Hippocampus comes TaxID=109280 RepID=A0A3Q3DHE4_HIPCM